MKYGLFLLFFFPSLLLSQETRGYTQSKNLKDVLTKYKSETDYYCGKKIKKKPGETSLFKTIQKDVRPYRFSKTTIKKEKIWMSGYVGTEPLRGGDDIFQTAADLIREAEHEVLIQTFIYDYQGPGTYMVHDAIYDLEKRQKEREKRGEKIKPIKVKFLLDDYYLLGGKIRFKTIGAIGFGKRSYKFKDNIRGYGLNLRAEPLDPKYVELEVRYWYNTKRGITHSKTFVIDREFAVVTGANFVSYHHVKETVGNKDSMEDHGFVLAGKDLGRGFAEDFYTVFNNSIYHTKDAAASNKSQIGKVFQVLRKYKCLCWGNLFGNDHEIAFQKKGDKKKPANKYTNFSNFKANPKFRVRRNFMKSMGKLKKVSLGLLVRVPDDKEGPNWEKEIIERRKNTSKKRKNYGAFWDKPKSSKDMNPQNAAWLSLIKNAKSHINIVSPNISSFEIEKALFMAILRGVDINILTNSHYEDKFYDTNHEMGSNHRSLRYFKGGLKYYKDLAIQNGADPSKMGKLRWRWYRKRSGALSGVHIYKSFNDSGLKQFDQWNHNHTKFMVADNQVVITGSGNLDSQSFHLSGETNFIVDDHKIASHWCKKVFAKDFIRSLPEGGKKYSGDSCYSNDECFSNSCKNVWLAKKLNLKKCLTFGDRCVCNPRPKSSYLGEFCVKNKHCKSDHCQKGRCSR